MDLEQLKQRTHAGERFKYLFFWGHQPERDGSVGKGCFSQWWPVVFELDGVSYRSAEHYMMAEKARLFGDDEALARILACQTPAEAKKLGRGVRGFTAEGWNAERFAIVVRGNVAKFSQYPHLGAYLKGTKDRVLVEASPRDRIWGIGMGASHEHAETPSHWRGLNLLGFALMETRAALCTTSA